MASRAPALTPQRRGVLVGPKSSTAPDGFWAELSVAVQGGQVVIHLADGAGDGADFLVSPASALEFGLSLVSHAEWVGTR